MNQWSKTRKRIILFIVLSALILIVGLPGFLIFYKAPSCSDGRHNGDENGVDCGGSCQRVCAPESLPIIVDGDPRILKVSDQAYLVVALLENPNLDAEVKKARYILRLYGNESFNPVKTIEGETYIPRGGSLVLFEGPFTTDANIPPTRAVLEWVQSSLLWEKTNRPSINLSVADNNLTRTDSSPRLEVKVKNLSLERANNIELTALVSDESGSIFAASKTFITSLNSGDETQAVFIWPNPFTLNPVKIEVVTRLLPDQSYLR